MLVDRLIIFFYSIPFVDCNDNTFSTLMRNTGNLCVLFRHTLRCINHNNDNICFFNGCNSTYNTETFQFFFDFALTTKSCCINKDILFSVVFYFCIYCISCCSCNIRYNDTIFSYQTVNQGRFSYIGFTYNSNFWNILILIFPCMFREMCNHFIQHISQA